MGGEEEERQSEEQNTKSREEPGRGNSASLRNNSRILKTFDGFHLSSFFTK